MSTGGIRYAENEDKQISCKTFQSYRNGQVKKSESLQEPYLNEEVHEEKEKSQTAGYYGCNEC
jgi:hypothetical protein